MARRAPSRRGSAKPSRARTASRPSSASRRKTPLRSTLSAVTSRAVAVSAPPSRHDSVAAPSRALGEAFSIPSGYGEDRIVLMVKDPWWLYAYWDITPGTERATRSQLLPQEVPRLQSVLRVYDVTDEDVPTGPARVGMDIPLSGLATHWYIQVNAPNRSFVVEIGLLTRSGRFLALARSNRVTTPRFGPSDVIDEAWQITDEAFWKLLGQAGVGLGSSPMDWAKLTQRPPASSQWLSAQKPVIRKRPAIPEPIAGGPQ